LGLDGAVGYLGAAAGASATRWLPRLRLDADMMIVAGGAAGLAAVFQQPLFGALFVVEAPFRVGIDVRRLPPALIGGLAGYAGFRLCLDTSPIVEVAAVDLNTRLIVAALLAGAVAGVVARGFGLLMVQARDLSASLVLPVRLLMAAAAVVGLFLASSLSDVDGLTLGSGGATLAWALDPRRATAVVLAIVVLRMVSTSALVVGGAVGGLLVPLLVVGGMSGRAVAGPVASNQLLVVAVLAGAAAMAAGYRVPFAGVAFAAVTLGSVAGLVPAILAVGSAMLVSPGVAVTTAQRSQVRTPAPGPARAVRNGPAQKDHPSWRRRPRASVLAEESDWADLGEEPWDEDAWEDPRA
jgi:H+/Cl- antiporter ClcA